jgi:NAD(P)-dependent dehydrogenase (short-subunit alcohol dehydrogenase family)
MKHVLITGCSPGLGEAAALRLAKAGYRVTGTVRRQSDVDRLAAAAGPDASWIQLDVADDPSVPRRPRRLDRAARRPRRAGQ